MKRFVMLATVILIAASIVWAMKTRQVSGTKVVSMVSSLTGDSTYKKDTIPLIGDAAQYRSYMLKVKIGASKVTTYGSHTVGAKDTARIVLKTQMGGAFYTIDSNLFTAIPCSLLSSKILNDTLIKENLVVMLYVADTISDTVITLNYPVSWDLIVKE